MRARENRRANGLCPDCGVEVVGCVRCRKCQTLVNVRVKKIHDLRKSQGLCIECGSDSDGELRCSKCSNRNKNRSKEFKSLRMAQGLCVCGCEPIEGSKNCKECYLKRTSMSMLGTRKLWKQLEEAFSNQNGICPYSGRQMTLGIDTSIDHVVPKSKGGTSQMDNLVWSHKMVNQMKWDNTKEEFLAMVSDVYNHCCGGRDG